MKIINLQNALAAFESCVGKQYLMSIGFTASGNLSLKLLLLYNMINKLTLFEKIVNNLHCIFQLITKLVKKLNV